MQKAIKKFNQIRKLKLPQSSKAISPLMHLEIQLSIMLEIFEYFLQQKGNKDEWQNFYLQRIQPKLNFKCCQNTRKYESQVVNTFKQANLQPNYKFINIFLVQFRNLCFKQKHLLPLYDFLQDKFNTFNDHFTDALLDLNLYQSQSIPNQPNPLAQLEIKTLNQKADSLFKYQNNAQQILQSPPPILRLAKDLDEMVQINLKKNFQYFDNLMQKAVNTNAKNINLAATIAQTKQWWLKEGAEISEKIIQKQEYLKNKIVQIEQDWKRRLFESQSQLAMLSKLVIQNRLQQAYRKAVGFKDI